MYIYIYIYIYMYTLYNGSIQVKQAWRLMKAIAEMKCDTEQTMKLE